MSNVYAEPLRHQGVLSNYVYSDDGVIIQNEQQQQNLDKTRSGRNKNWFLNQICTTSH